MIMNRISAIALDLDGTTLNTDLKISSANKEAIFKAKKQGIKIILCTGRPFNGIKTIIQELELNKDAENCLVVTYNGALVQDCRDGCILYESQIPFHSFESISKFFKDTELGVHAMTIDKMYTYDKAINPYTIRESYLGNLPLQVIEETADPLQKNIVKIMVVGEQLYQYREPFFARYSEEFSLNQSESFYLEVMAKGMDKARGLEFALNHYQISKSELIAFGNNDNDISMIKLAKIGIAVDNGTNQLKKNCDMITLSNDNNGVAHALHKLIN